MEKFKNEITLKRVLALVGLIFLVIFIIQNWSKAELSLIFFSIKLPFIIWVVIIYLLGALSGWAFNKKRQ